MNPRPIKEPTNFASEYTLDLYCDHENDAHGWREFPHSYTGETFAECARAARNGGWVIHRKLRTATCRKCAARVNG